MVMPSTILAALVEAINPDYRVDTIRPVFPLRSDAEMIGATAGRIYLREQNRIYAVTMSDIQLRTLRDRLTEILEADDGQ